VGDRFRGLALQVRSDLTSQINDTIQRLHIDLIWRRQRRMLIQQCPYLGRDLTVAGASAGPALSVCAVCGTSGKSARKDDDEGENAQWFTPTHLIRVRAHLRPDLQLFGHTSIPHGIDRTNGDQRGRMYCDAIMLRVQMIAGTYGEKRSGLRGGVVISGC
jgi:hypothetical protein